jgi:hypothetical protein
MKPITFSKTSWHYKMVDKIIGMPQDYYDNDIPMDICTYSRKLFGCLLLLALAAACAIGLVLIPVADFAMWVLVGLSTGWVEVGIGGVVIVEAVIAVIFVMAYGIAMIVETRKKYKRAMRLKNSEEGVPEPEPSLAVELYRKFKTKTCVRITFN